jgi:hypothetical protein
MSQEESTGPITIATHTTGINRTTNNGHCHTELHFNSVSWEFIYNTKYKVISCPSICLFLVFGHCSSRSGCSTMWGKQSGKNTKNNGGNMTMPWCALEVSAANFGCQTQGCDSHPHYCPHLTPRDFLLFLRLKSPPLFLRLKSPLWWQHFLEIH